MTEMEMKVKLADMQQLLARHDKALVNYGQGMLNAAKLMQELDNRIKQLEHENKVLKKRLNAIDEKGPVNPKFEVPADMAEPPKRVSEK